MEDLRCLVDAQLGAQEGRVHSPLPSLRFYRTSEALGPKRVEAHMVTFALILQGRKVVDFGARPLAYDPGSYLFVTGERRYLATIENCSRARPYTSISLELAPERVAEAAFALGEAGLRFSEQEEDTPAVVAALEPELVDALARLVETLGDPIGRAVLAPHFERELMIHLLRSPAGATLRRAAAVDDERIQRARRYLHEHLTERVSVEELARHVAMSPSHFAHRFREVVRMSPIQYLKHQRLQRARLLMLGDGLGVAEAGAEVGYASASHFTRDFKGRFGQAPGAYVRRFR